MPGDQGKTPNYSSKGPPTLPNLVTSHLEIDISDVGREVSPELSESTALSFLILWKYIIFSFMLKQNCFGH